MRAWLAGCLLLAACAADIPENVFPCSDGCPPEFVCRADGYCWRTADGSDAGPAVDAGPGLDAGPGVDAGDGGPGLDDGGPDAGACVVAGCPAGLLCRDDGACVECLADTDCTGAAASRCEDGTCVPCADPAQCAHVVGANVCDAAAGGCVECTEANTAACGGRPCTSEHTCSDYGPAQDTCEPCDTDANCGGPDDYCVPMMDTGGVDRGAYCLTDWASGCTQPFSTRLEGRTTRSGRTGGAYCGIDESLVTCEAVLARGEPCDSSMPCPESGLCRSIAGMDECTYGCNASNECPVGDTCNAAGAPSYCE